MTDVQPQQQPPPPPPDQQPPALKEPDFYGPPNQELGPGVIYDPVDVAAYPEITEPPAA